MQVTKDLAKAESEGAELRARSSYLPASGVADSLERKLSVVVKDRGNTS